MNILTALVISIAALIVIVGLTVHASHIGKIQDRIDRIENMLRTHPTDCDGWPGVER